MNGCVGTGDVQKELVYALLTDERTKAWSGMETRQYKRFKDLKKENLRANTTNMELVLNMLAKLSAIFGRRPRANTAVVKNRVADRRQCPAR